MALRIAPGPRRPAPGLANPDGSNTTACLDAEGNTVAILLTFEE
ncbi:hypothetical protein ACFVUY_21775 [Kitasatospora sp. NPDC058063]